MKCKSKVEQAQFLAQQVQTKAWQKRAAAESRVRERAEVDGLVEEWKMQEKQKARRALARGKELACDRQMQVQSKYAAVQQCLVEEHRDAVRQQREMEDQTARAKAMIQQRKRQEWEDSMQAKAENDVLLAAKVEEKRANRREEKLRHEMYIAKCDQEEEERATAMEMRHERQVAFNAAMNKVHMERAKRDVERENARQLATSMLQDSKEQDMDRKAEERRRMEREGLEELKKQQKRELKRLREHLQQESKAAIALARDAARAAAAENIKKERMRAKAREVAAYQQAQIREKERTKREAVLHDMTALEVNLNKVTASPALFKLLLFLLLPTPITITQALLQGTRVVQGLS
ncbi:unnamed protein product [Chrysoparadoxa australica]